LFDNLQNMDNVTHSCNTFINVLQKKLHRNTKLCVTNNVSNTYTRIVNLCYQQLQ
jgi:hypothetical protein